VKVIMDCDCETGCYKCSNYPKEMDEHVKQTKCEGCKSFICHCGMDGTFFYSYNPHTKFGNMLFDSPPKRGYKRVIYLDIRNRHTKGPILDDEVSVKYIPLSIWDRLRKKVLQCNSYLSDRSHRIDFV